MILFYKIFLGIWLLSFSYDESLTEAQNEGAKITFENTTHNFGDVSQGDKVTHAFKFKNSGDQPLIISNVLATCGCTATKWTKEPVKPGESGQITVEFDSSGRSGKQNKVVTIISNTANPQTRINVVVNILPGRDG